MAYSKTGHGGILKDLRKVQIDSWTEKGEGLKQAGLLDAEKLKIHAEIKHPFVLTE